MARKRITPNDPIVSGGGPAAQPLRNLPGAIRPKHTAVPPETLTFSTSEPQQFQAAAQHEPAREEIARLAFSYWESRGRQGGSAEEDWLRAEKELRSRRAVALV
jgi:hypothetical protein